MNTFESKNIMSDEEHNEYSAMAHVHQILHCGLPTFRRPINFTNLDEDKNIGTRLGSDKDSEEVRKGLGTSHTYVDIVHIEIWRMANALDDALGDPWFRRNQSMTR